MPRPTASPAEAINIDSFPDIVASVVSIMIIMVVLVGIRIKKAPVPMAIPDAPATAELNKELAAEQALRADVWRMAEEIRGLRRQAVVRGAERDLLATTLAAARQHESTRGSNNARSVDFELAHRLAVSKSRFERLLKERQAIEQSPGETVLVESYPTPISREVDGPEAHWMLAGGRVTYIPLETILDELRSQVKRQVHRLADQPELSDTIGPIDGFQLRYTIERHDVSLEGPRGGSIQTGSYARLEQWTLIPTRDDLGEPVRLALAPESEFRRTLSKILPGRTTVTLWVYPDSFEAFRQIRKELYRLGYAIAARPLPAGTPIGGSPEGSKSAAQ